MSLQKIILFDGICNLCNNTIQFIIKNEEEDTFLFASLQSDFGQNFLKEHHLNSTDFDSIILIENNKYYTKSTAALKISRDLKKPWKWISYLQFIPKIIRDSIYNFIAKNRYSFFGKKNSCWLPTASLQEKFLK